MKIIDIDEVTTDSLDKGISLDLATKWWSKLCDLYHNDIKPRSEREGNIVTQTVKEFLDDYKRKNGNEYLDEDLKSLLGILSKKSFDGYKNSGYSTLRPIIPQHTSISDQPFEDKILIALRQGKIVIADLSSGDEELQRMYSERITRRIFRDSMNRFTNAQPNNFIQFYFEEAHNLFPKKDDKNLSQIYNRLAKEGAKLNLGLVYATQEVSSISSNILKATQNWFISHLNNEDEIKELRKYYDFSDFSDSLIRFSQNTDKGFVRVKTYSNSFVVPVQIDKFGK